MRRAGRDLYLRYPRFALRPTSPGNRPGLPTEAPCESVPDVSGTNVTSSRRPPFTPLIPGTGSTPSSQATCVMPCISSPAAPRWTDRASRATPSSSRRQWPGWAPRTRGCERGGFLNSNSQHPYPTQEETSRRSQADVLFVGSTDSLEPTGTGRALALSRTSSRRAIAPRSGGESRARRAVNTRRPWWL